MRSVIYLSTLSDENLTTCNMTTHHRRTSIDRLSVQATVRPGQLDHPVPLLTPHIGNSPNRPYFALVPPSISATRHSRAISNKHRPKYLSLSFPVAAGTGNEPGKGTSSSSTPLSTTPSSPLDSRLSPSDPDGFLVALASQERRVLELREELHKAEEDLKKLKQQWTCHEAYKEKAEVRCIEPMQVLRSQDSQENSSAELSFANRRDVEMDRRRAILTTLSIPKDTRRKFSGAHTRALSLLSPERSELKQPSPFGPSLDVEPDEKGMSHSAFIPDMNEDVRKISATRSRNSYRKSGVAHSAKQIAEDVKAGMWTFLEDLRQATVGDEGVYGTTNRSTTEFKTRSTRRDSRSSLLSVEKGKRAVSPRATSPRTWETLTGNSGWSETEPRSLPKSPTKIKTNKPLSLAVPVMDDMDDSWANWDSPPLKSPRWSSSTTISGPTTPININVADKTLKYDAVSNFPSFKIDSSGIIDQLTDDPIVPKIREEINWPAFERLSPGNLKGNLQRTMSSIMKEWETSVTPPAEDIKDPISQCNRSRSATNTMDRSSIQDDAVLMS